MHNIRSRARRHAWHWKDGDPEATRWCSLRSNSQSSRSMRDLESGPSGVSGSRAPDLGTTRELPSSDRQDFAPDGKYTLSPQDTETNVAHNRGDVNQSNGFSDSKTVADDSPIPPTDQNLIHDPEKHGAADTYYNGADVVPPTSAASAGPQGVRKRDKLTGIFKKKNSAAIPGMEQEPSSESKAKKHFTIWGQIKVVIFGSWINVLLICVPVGIALWQVPGANPYAVFAVNFVAILPLAGILSYATEEIAMRVGETLGGLLNASFGNAVELIVSVIALTQDQIIVVQTSLIGSILSNLLLVMGMCFFFGGIHRIEQFFNVTVAQTAASLLALAVGALIIPTCFHRFGTGGTDAQREEQIPKLSRGMAIILLLVYAAYLFFQLSTHSTMFKDTGGAGTRRKPSKGDAGSIRQAVGAMGAGSAAHAGGSVNQQIFDPEAHQERHGEEEEEQPQLSYIGAMLTLGIATALVGVTSEAMVSGIPTIAEVIPPEFIGLILIPIVGNAAEHATAVTVAIKDKMDLAIGVAVGSSMQIALLVIPVVVIIGWGLGKDDMTLEFDGFLLTVVFVAVLLVNYLIGDGRSHWLEGVMLMMLYVIIAVAAYLYPADASVAG